MLPLISSAIKHLSSAFFLKPRESALRGSRGCALSALQAVRAPLTSRPRGTIYAAMPFILERIRDASRHKDAKTDRRHQDYPEEQVHQSCSILSCLGIRACPALRAPTVGGPAG